MGQEAASSLAAANKRIGNILRKADEDISKVIDTDRLVLDEERNLFKEISSLEKKLEPLLEAADYATSLGLLAGIAQARR